MFTATTGNVHILHIFTVIFHVSALISGKSRPQNERRTYPEAIALY